MGLQFPIRLGVRGLMFTTVSHGKKWVNAGRIIQLGHYASHKNHILLFQSYEIIIFPHDITGWWIENPSEKYEFVSWEYYSQYMEISTCSKPPATNHQHFPLKSRWSPYGSYADRAWHAQGKGALAAVCSLHLGLNQYGNKASVFLGFDLTYIYIHIIIRMWICILYLYIYTHVVTCCNMLWGKHQVILRVFQSIQSV